MKKKYIAPAQNVVQLLSETPILAISDMENSIEVKISDDVANGSEALSKKKRDLWEASEIWD